MKAISIIFILLEAFCSACSSEVYPLDFTTPTTVNGPEVAIEAQGTSFSLSTAGNRWLYFDAKKNYQYYISVKEISGGNQKTYLYGSEKKTLSSGIDYSDSLNGEFIFSSVSDQRLYILVKVTDNANAGSFLAEYSAVPLTDGKPVISESTIYTGALQSPKLLLNFTAGKSYLIYWAMLPETSTSYLYGSCTDGAGIALFSEKSHVSWLGIDHEKVTSSSSLPAALTLSKIYDPGKYRVYFREEKPGCTTTPIALVKGQWSETVIEGENFCQVQYFVINSTAGKTYTVYLDSFIARNGKTSRVTFLSFNGISSSVTTYYGDKIDAKIFTNGISVTASSSAIIISINGYKGTAAVKYE